MSIRSGGYRAKGLVHLISVLAIVVLFSATAAAGDEFDLLRLDGHLVKWGSSHLGSGATVSYAYVTSPMRFPEARNCRAMSSLDGLAQTSGIPPSQLHHEVEAAFAMWQAAADISFHLSGDPESAQILIGAQTNPRRSAFANVASYEADPDVDIRRIERSLICLNPRKVWKIGFGGDLSIYDLRYALAHEIGHAIGLNHPSPSGHLMSFRYEERLRDLTAGDVAGVTSLYGPRPADRDAREVADRGDTDGVSTVPGAEAEGSQQ